MLILDYIIKTLHCKIKKKKTDAVAKKVKRESDRNQGKTRVNRRAFTQLRYDTGWKSVTLLIRVPLSNRDQDGSKKPFFVLEQ